MMKFSILEYTVLNSLKTSLEKSFLEAIQNYGVNSEDYRVITQRLTTTTSERAANPHKYPSATVKINEFVSTRHLQTAKKLIADYKALDYRDQDETYLWGTVTLLATEGLIELDGTTGLVFITPAGLSSLRENDRL